MEKILIVLLAMVMLMAGPCLAFDGYQGHEGEIPLCQNNKTGALRFAPTKDIDPTTKVNYEPYCYTNTETLIWINIQGVQGLQGLQGIQGEKGDKGDQGLQGIQGNKGDKGDEGDQGLQGIQGVQGPQGPQGEAGVGLNPIQVALLRWYEANQTGNQFSVGASPIGIAFDGASIWVANYGSNNVTKLRASDGADLGTFAVGSYPYGIAFDGASIWVGNYGSAFVSKL